MIPFIHLMAQGPKAPLPPLLIVEKAYVSSAGTLSGPAGWSCVRNGTGSYTVDFGIDVTVDGVAAWAIGFYSGTDSFATPTCNVEFSSVNRSEMDVWTPRGRDGGERDQAFYVYLVQGTADTVKKAILRDGGTFNTTPFSPPTGWTSSKTGTGQYRVTPTGGQDLLPISGEVAVCTLPYGQNNPTEPKQATTWEPSAPTTNMDIETRRLLDGALQDRDSYIVWIDAVPHREPAATIGARINGGTFIGGTPTGWTANSPSGGLTEVDVNKGVLPQIPVQDGLAFMANAPNGLSGNGGGVCIEFDGTSQVQCQTFRLLDGAATDNKPFFLTTIQGTPPE